ncbi:MAG: hypothetical protein DRQ55_14080 [Planctomycetota bacterium]|nr:MAG: hypothetical protein DRQ55_14080 [Planctomycetota bacterium]
MFVLLLAGGVWSWLDGGMLPGSGRARSVPRIASKGVTYIPGEESELASERVPLRVTSVPPASEPLPTSAQAAAGDAAFDAEERGRLVARWPALSVPREVRLVAEKLTSVSEEARVGAPRVLLGFIAQPMAPTGDALPPSAQANTQRTWDDLEAGSWRVVAAADSLWIPARSLPVEVHPGETRFVELELVPAGQLVARLVRPDGDPVPGADVRLLGPLPPGFDLHRTSPDDHIGVVERRLKTDLDGELSVAGVVVGDRYALYAWTDAGDQGSAMLLSRPPPCSAEQVQLTPAVMMDVFVRESDSGVPLAGVEVRVTDHVLSSLRGERELMDIDALREIKLTDEQGRTSLSCEPGSWILVVSASHDIATVQVTPELAARGRYEAFLDLPERSVGYVTTVAGDPLPDVRVSASWTGFRDGVSESGSLSSTTTDARGEFELADMGSLPDLDMGSVSFQAEHSVHGSGGVEVPLPPLKNGERVMPVSIMLRQTGGLQLEFEPTTWPEPMYRAPRRNMGADDRLEQALKDDSLSLKLKYLGNSGARTEFSSEHGARRSVKLSGFFGAETSAEFDDLVPGIYSVTITSRSRDFRLHTPSLRVYPGEVTHYFVQPPDVALFATVTLDLSTTPLQGPRGERSLEVCLMTVEKQPGHGALPILLPPNAGEWDMRRVRIQDNENVTFTWVPPGRYTLLLPVQDPADPNNVLMRMSHRFTVGPGDDLILRSLK